MATYVSYTPTTAIGQAMFNFDPYSISNFKLSGIVRVSVSDGFSYSDWLVGSFDKKFILGITSSSEFNWTSQAKANIQGTLGVYSQFANITFSAVTDCDSVGSDSTANPADVGRANVSDINITWCSSAKTSWGAISGGNGSPQISLNYTGCEGDIILNLNFSSINDGYNFADTTKSRQVLMHELGHSLGLSHPHSSYDAFGSAIITSDFAATRYLGFSQLGFRLDSAADMNKEYFTIMSYDDENTLPHLNAYTPMILDVIALQQAYGEGIGTHGSGNDTIVTENTGYRTYFDTGGIDTINLSNYSYAGGSYLNMGVSIIGASHLVGISMSLLDAQTTILNGGNPASLRWFYGEYENAYGTASTTDLILGNVLNNSINGLGGDDLIYGGDGSDWLYGGDGTDILNGDTGNDLLFGGNGNDTLKGGDGIDFLYGEVGNDILSGGAGGDGLLGGIGDDVLNGDGGEDWIFGGDGNDMETGGDSVDFLYGEAGNDALSGGTGGDGLLGGDGSDVLNGDAGEDWMYGEGGNDTLNGGDGVDFLYGGAGSDIINGGANLDALIGGEGNDVLSGGDGDDWLYGESGDDRLIGGVGNDILTGGTGSDTFVFAPNLGQDSVMDFSITQGDHISITTGINGILTTADALLHLGSDANGNTVLDFGGGNSVTLIGIQVASLHASDFVIA